MPPLSWRPLLGAASAFDRIGRIVWPAFAGVIVVAAVKRTVQGIKVRARPRLVPALRPALGRPPERSAAQRRESRKIAWSARRFQSADPDSAVEHPAVAVERHRLLDARVDLVDQVHEIAHRAEMDVRRVVPAVGQVLGDRHAAAAGRTAARMRQLPKFGNETTTFRPIRSISSSTRRGLCVACSVWLRMTKSKASSG